VGELEQTITTRELREWAEVFATEPPGWERVDLAAATICAVVCNLLRDPNRQPFAPSDFLPRWGPRRQTPEDQLAILSAWREMLNG